MLSVVVRARLVCGCAFAGAALLWVRVPRRR